MSERPVVLVTGAARGIGAATVRAFVEAGWSAVAVDAARDDGTLSYALGSRAELDGVVAGCGGHAIAVVADVRRQDELDDAVDAAVREFGGLDAVVTAAGVISGGELGWETTDDQWNVNVDVNLTGTWRTARAAIPALLQRPEPRRGRVVAVASAAGLAGHARLAAYVAAKHGVIGLVRSLAVELAPLGITANAVCPGSTDTAILAASADVYGLASVDEFAVHHPIGRLLEPDEIAAAILWLCGPDRGGVTGIALPVDGGMTI